jgi:predicted PurR-regulated permease PerM
MERTTLRTLWLLVVIVGVVALAYMARSVVTPLLVALLLAYILDPVVRFLERRGLSRGVASAAVVVLALAALVTVTVAAAARFAKEAGAFYDGVAGELCEPAAQRAQFEEELLDGVKDPADRQRVLSRVREAEWDGAAIVYEDRDDDRTFEPGHAAEAMKKIRDAARGRRWEQPVLNALGEVSKVGPKIAKSAGELLTGLVSRGQAELSTVLGIVTLVFLFPIYLFYSLVNLSRVHDVTVSHLPSGQRARVVEILAKIHATLSAFFRGRLITMLVKGLLLLGLFVGFGVPFSYVCAAFAAIASLVPVIGGVVAAIPPVVLAMPDSTGGEIGGLVAGIVVIELLETYVLLPGLVGRQVGLHPLTVLVCTLIAGELLGVFGMIVAVPLTAVAKILARQVGLHPLTVLVCTLIAGELLGVFGMIVAVPLTAVAKILAAEFVLPEIRRRAGLPPEGAAPAKDAPSTPEGRA